MNLLNTNALALKLGISERTLRAWLKENRVPPGFLLKNRRYWTEESVDAAIQAMQQDKTTLENATNE